ncbi:hypothetical protein H5410_005173, partial [Solanum commersonii]
MDDWDKSLFGDEYSYKYPCNYCNVHHLDIEGDELENAKQEARNVNSLMECTNMLEKVNSKIIEQIFECGEEQSNIMKLLDKLDAIQLEITVQAKLEEIESQQGESYGETEIVIQSLLQEQTQLLKFQESIRDGLTYMKTQLIKGTQLPIVVDDDQLVEQKEEFQPFNYTLLLSIDAEKEYKSENV